MDQEQSTESLKAKAYDLTCQARAITNALKKINEELLKRKELIIDVEVT